jgi:hypothetical protein
MNKTGVIQLRVTTNDKNVWKLKAKDRGLTLTAWIIEKCNYEMPMNEVAYDNSSDDYNGPIR